MIIYNGQAFPEGIGNYGASTETGLTYDLVLFNNAERKAYLYRNLFDAGGPLHYQINRFDIGDVPTGEYEYALIRNTRGYVEYTFKNALLDSYLEVDGTTYRIGDLLPVLGLLKYIGEDTGEEPVYRDTEKAFYYHKK